MIELFRGMLATPEAQPDPHYWASVLLAHAMIGVILTGLLLAMRPRLGVYASGLVTLAYGLIWEGGQILATAAAGLSPNWADAVVDTGAVAIGALYALALAEGRLRVGILALTVMWWAVWRGVKSRR